MKNYIVLIALVLAIATISPASALINVVQNGTFESGMAHWTPWTYGPGSHSVGTVAEGMPGLAIELVSTDSGDTNNTTSARQSLDTYVEYVSCLYVSAKVKIIGQSHRSTLYQPCEWDFPAIISLHYLDADGVHRAYKHGFYLTSTLGFVRDSTQITAGEWYDFMSPNLMEYLPYAPVQLTRVEVLGMGWDYEAHFDNVAVSVCSAVPEPSSLLCLATMGAAMPAVLRVQRRRTRGTRKASGCSREARK